MSVAIDIFECMFEHGEMSRTAVIDDSVDRAEPTDRAEQLRELQARITQMQGTRLDTRDLPTHPAIAPLLPGGALQQGAAYSVQR
jgi:hypothetical protein